MATPQIDRLLENAVKQGATDLHLAVGKPPILRVNHSFRELPTKPLEPEDTMALMKAITPERIQQEFEESGGGDFGFAFHDIARFRVSIFKQKGFASLVLRRLPTKLLNFDEIGLPKIIEQLCHRTRGIFLCTGPTGCGKTTTLASMVNHINHNYERHIITLEDPIEYYHKHNKSIVVQRELGVDVPNFPEALRRSLRQDPDVIMVGEMRDLATISAALTAAETGHLVFGTLHTSGAASTINRIVDAFPTDQQEQVRTQMSSSLIAVLSQVLCPRIDVVGMIAAYEFMYVTSGIQNLIRENKSFRIDGEIQTGKRFSMQLLDDSLFAHYAAGKISAESCRDKSRNPAYMAERLKKQGAAEPVRDDPAVLEEAEPVAASSPEPVAASAPAQQSRHSNPQNEAERQALIQANRERMLRLQQKR
jgi:twitching motility protein PilT